MKNPLFLSLSIFAGVGLIGSAGCKPRTVGIITPTPLSTDTKSALPVLRDAPTWKLQDVNGKAVSSSQFAGKVVVVDFWATWCPPCRAEIPGYVSLQKKYGADGLVIIGVSLDQKGPEHVKKFVQDQKMNYTVVMGDDEVVTAFGGMDAIPTTFLIDRDGKIRDRKMGAVATDEYERRIKAVLGK
jgi:thiol-disulfide isomerase/thioredoxin